MHVVKNLRHAITTNKFTSELGVLLDSCGSFARFATKGVGYGRVRCNAFCLVTVLREVENICLGILLENGCGDS